MEAEEGWSPRVTLTQQLRRHIIIDSKVFLAHTSENVSLYERMVSMIVFDDGMGYGDDDGQVID